MCTERDSVCCQDMRYLAFFCWFCWCRHSDTNLKQLRQFRLAVGVGTLIRRRKGDTPSHSPDGKGSRLRALG